jgi:7,8-dihydroneopterin aldolase/epimerase/oxygenase
MITIQLNQLRFRSFHGLYAQEKVSGNDFEVNVLIRLSGEIPISKLDQTVDYAVLYRIIENRMAIATPLLETVAQELVDQLHDHDPRIGHVSVSVKKLHPPIAGFTGNICVSVDKDF